MARPRKKLALEVERAIRTLARDGYAPAQILAYVQRKYPEQTEKLDARTVQRRVKEYGPPDTSEPWALATASPEEAAVVLPVLGSRLAEAATLARIFGPDDPLVQASTRRITTGLAKWIVKVATAAPTLPPAWVEIIAREYREPGLTDPADLDALLALRPWESEQAAATYEQLIEIGVIKPLSVGELEETRRWWRAIRKIAQLRQEMEESEEGDADNGNASRSR